MSNLPPPRRQHQNERILPPLLHGVRTFKMGFFICVYRHFIGAVKMFPFSTWSVVSVKKFDLVGTLEKKSKISST